MAHIPDLGVFLDECARSGVAPDQALAIYFSTERTKYNLAKAAFKNSPEWQQLFRFLSSPVGIAWLRADGNIEKLFVYLRMSLVDIGKK